MIEESWLLPFVDRAAEAGGIAFDIGANTGEWAVMLAQKFAGVLAVEPDPRAFEALRSARALGVCCQHAAVTSRNGAVDLFMRPDAKQSSLLLEHPIGAGGQADAPVIETCGVNALTLDFLLFIARERFGQAPVSFIKVDVEGAEADVLAGATDPVFRAVRWLIEVHDRKVEVVEQFERLGYDAVEVIPHPHEAAHPNHLWIYAEPPDA